PNQTIVFALTGAGGYPSGTTGSQPTNPTTPGTALGGVGILRSTDGGKSWKILDSTVNADPAGNIYPIDAQTGTGAGQRDRVFFTSQATSALSMTRMIGNDGNNLIVQGTNNPVPVAQPAGTDPNFGAARYVIAAPAVTNSPLLNTFYRDWLYVARVTAQGN